MSADERAIRELVNTWMKASQSGDVETVLSLMADDVIFMVPGAAPFGKKQFAEAARKMRDVRVEGNADVEEIVVVGDWAWYRTHLIVTMTPPNGTPERRSGYAMTIARRGPDGRWLLARDANLLTPTAVESERIKGEPARAMSSTY